MRTVEQQRLIELIDETRKLTTYPDIAWDDFCWDLTEDETKRAHDNRRLNLYFTRSRKSRKEIYEPFEQPYADFTKTIIRQRASQRGVGFKSQKRMVMTLRCLYETLVRTSTTDPTALKPQHFQTAVIEIHKAYSEATAYALSMDLKEISDYIDFYQITCTPINFQNPISHPSHEDGLDEASQARGLEKMPSQAALRALAQASSEPLDEDERILLRVIDLFVVGGFRAGEGLTLPIDCWVEEMAFGQDGQPQIDPATGKGKMRYGLRYWPEKGGEPVVKWLPDCSVPVAKRAVEELKRLCAEARRVAALLEQNPDRVPLPGNHNADDIVDLQQLSTITGFPYSGSVNKFINQDLKVPSVGLKRPKGRGGAKRLYQIGDVEEALVKRRGRLEVIRFPNGKVQKLSESLCVMFSNQFDAWRPTLHFLPQLIGYRQITTALGNALNAESIFSRRKLTEPDGSPMRIRTHAFRHWLNTLADKGGLSDIEQALWMGRRDLRQNAAYKHGTVEQRVDKVREMLRDGKLYGEAVDIYNSINDPVEKESFLYTYVTTAHHTPFGICIHDFALDPCPFHLNCLRGCPEYLRTKGDEDERRNILELRVFTACELEKAESAMQGGEWNASNWVDFNQRLLEGADAALAVDDNESWTDGETVPVFPQGERIGQPLT